MVSDSLRPLGDFGTRSLVTHAIMALTFTGAVLSAVVVGGDLGIVSFVAFVNFTAGMWVCQSIHSAGNAVRDDADYDGVLSTLRAR